MSGKGVQRERENFKQTALSMELDVGLDPMTLTS